MAAEHHEETKTEALAKLLVSKTEALAKLLVSALAQAPAAILAVALAMAVMTVAVALVTALATAGAVAKAWATVITAGATAFAAGSSVAKASKILARNQAKSEVTIQKLERNWSRFGIILPVHARKKYFQPSLGDQLADCHEELANALDQTTRDRIIARYRKLAFLAAVDSLRMVIQRRLANELAWVVGKLSKS